LPKDSAAAPAKSIPALQEKALELIGSSSEGVLQSELKGLLGIQSGRCSRVVSRLESSGLISREKAARGRSRTYLIRIKRKRRPGGSSRRKNIDTFLTEIYLLYLIRGSTS
jgi:DNA-binding MarR family transcriptional regulator